MSKVYVFLAVLSVTFPVRTITSFLLESQSTTPWEFDFRSTPLKGLEIIHHEYPLHTDSGKHSRRISGTKHPEHISTRINIYNKLSQ